MERIAETTTGVRERVGPILLQRTSSDIHLRPGEISDPSGHRRVRDRDISLWEYGTCDKPSFQFTGEGSPLDSLVEEKGTIHSPSGSTLPSVVPGSDQGCTNQASSIAENKISERGTNKEYCTIQCCVCGTLLDVDEEIFE